MPKDGNGTTYSREMLAAGVTCAAVLLLFVPVLYTAFKLHHLAPTGLVIAVFGTLLLARFASFESRTGTRPPPKHLKNSLRVVAFICLLLTLNFALGAIMGFAHGNATAVAVNFAVCASILAYFGLVVKLRPFEKLNARLHRTWKGRLERRNHEPKFLGRHLFATLVAAWAAFSLAIFAVPYQVSVQGPLPPGEGLGGRRLGFWTGGSPVDPANNQSSQYFDDDTMDLLGGVGGYLVYGCRQNTVDGDLTSVLNRCRAHGVEVHLYRCPLTPGESYANAWTFQKLMNETEATLVYLLEEGFLGDPVTTVVYDMEGLPGDLHFPFYGFDPGLLSKLREYYAVQEEFRDYNRHLREDYNLSVRICTDYTQKWDALDGDDDLSVLWGVMSSEPVNWSYMAYRRDNLGYNFLTDHFRFLGDGDTIILNSWKFDDYACHADLECLVEECRLVLGFREKRFNLEFWALRNFLPSYGVQGFRELVHALTDDPSSWPEVHVVNQFPCWPFWDLVIVGFSSLDLYGPLFRLAYWLP
ncbi:MAG: hypothetical protein ACTSU5_22090 [Promethearchaeota archaeon]